MHASKFLVKMMSLPEQVLQPQLATETIARIDSDAARSLDASTTFIDVTCDAQLRVWLTLSEHCNEGIMICDPYKRILYVNAAFERVTGFSASEAIGYTPAILKSGEQDAAFYASMWSDIFTKGYWRGEICNRRKNGDLYSEWLTLAAVRNADNEIIHYVAVFSDLTQRKRTEETVRHLVSHDPLTQLPNRHSLTDRLAGMIDDAAANDSRVALMLLDLDQFKTINDSLGHESGDLLLRSIGERLKRSVRSADVVARLGGDEFAIALPNVSDASAADRIARKVLAQIALPLTIDNRELELSACIGVCLYPDDAQDASGLIRNADTAMYRAKRRGRGSRTFYTSAMSREARERLDLESALLRAIRYKQFVLHYQPQIDLRTGEILSVEALIRWKRPGVGLVMPGDFITLAEERGLIAEIGDWVLEEAAVQSVLWDRAGLPPFGIAVNVSASQFHGNDFVERLTRILTYKHLAMSRLELEITENIIMRDSEATLTILEKLRALGVSLSIDDFGTGYSSLSYLRRFPIDEIKIDRSFVHEMTKDEGAAGIVRGIIELAHSLKLQVIAEGVETCEQLKRLMDLKCDRVQGYLVSRPVPAAEFEEFLAQWPKRWHTMTG